MQCGMATEAVIVKVCEFFGPWPLHTKSHVSAQFSDVAEPRCVEDLQVIKVVELVGYFFGYIAATFFIANKPEPGMPGSVSVKIIHPVLKSEAKKVRGRGRRPLIRDYFQNQII